MPHINQYGMVAMRQAQTKEQFSLMYGDRESWSRTTSAVYEILFHNIARPVASRTYDVSRQAIQRFMNTNKLKHMERIDMETAQAYLKAGS